MDTEETGEIEMDGRGINDALNFEGTYELGESFLDWASRGMSRVESQTF